MELDSSSSVDALKQILLGAQSDLLYFASMNLSPDQLARKIVGYCCKFPQFEHALIVFQSGYRLCDENFPISEKTLNERHDEESRREMCALFERFQSQTVSKYEGPIDSAPLRKIIGEDVLNLFKGVPLLAARVVWRNYRAIGLIVCFGNDRAQFIREEELFLKHVAETLGLKLRSLISQYFGEKFKCNLVSRTSPFVEGRRRVAALFCDLRNFTPFTSLFQGEARVTDGLQTYFKEAERVIFEHEGMLDKFIGDGIMALFGVTARSDGDFKEAVRHACDTAKELQQVFKRIKKDSFAKMLEDRSEYLDLQIGIGIDVGTALLGFFGGQYNKSYSAIGDSINTSARLESLAGKEYEDGPGRVLSNVLVGAAAYRLLPDEYRRINFEREPVLLQVKGKPLKIEAYEMKYSS
ncbi:MAG TPA: adenylate/guanylate cyclase domain-containing protein [Pyrinomonadaceae bacterium]|jgi:class 3 adenylate cyclase|nr:adenylate/guanylate cyclase domain-containing protein [Pyrinomonadaceae bacterium]